MINICGKGYIIEHYVSFLRLEAKEKSYQTYVTDALRVIANNSAHKKDDVIINSRWIELIDNVQKEAPEEEKTAEEVIDNIFSKLEKYGKRKIVKKEVKDNECI